LKWAQVFMYSRPWLPPSTRLWDWGIAVRLLKIGFVYMVISMSIAVGYTSDSIVLAKMLGAESVTTYSIIYRLFAIVIVMVSFFLLPLWPAYGEAIAKGDLFWVRRTLRRSIVAAFIFNTTGGVLLLCFGKWIIWHWVGDAIHPTMWLLLPFTLYLIVAGVHGPLSMLLNGLRVIRFQLLCWAMMAVTNIIFSIILTHLMGIAGVMYGTAISTLFFLVLPEAWYTWRVLNRADGLTESSAPSAPLGQLDIVTE